MTKKAPIQLSFEQTRWFRLRRSGLIEPFPCPEDVVATFVGVQAQILPAAALSLWNRTRALTHAEFEELLYGKRTLVKLWGQRGTLHLYPSAEWPLIHSARAINRTWWEKRAERLGSDLEAYRHLVEQIAEKLRHCESMGRSGLRTSGIDLPEELYSPWGGIFADLVRLGYVCHAGRVGNEGHFVHRERWLPDLAWNPPDPEVANTTIAARYFAAYGPATSQDFLYWRGATNAAARSWFNSLQDQLVEVEVAGKSMLALAADVDQLCQSPPDRDAWPIRMLYRFDPLLLAHKEKTWITDAEHYKAIWRSAGHIEGILLVHGRALGTWRYERKGNGITVYVAAFTLLPAPVLQAVHDIAPRIASFFDAPLIDLVIE